jgi:hypothetical protein
LNSATRNGKVLPRLIDNCTAGFTSIFVTPAVSGELSFLIN